MLQLPPNHPERFVLADEVHARPPVPLETPSRASYVALLVDADERPREQLHIRGLCERHGIAPPPAGATHFMARLGALRFKWERHGEFSGYTVFVDGASPAPFAEPAASLLPPGWLAGLPGATLAAAHAKLAMMANWDLHALQDDLAKVAVPVSLVVGSADRTVPPKQSAEVLQQLPASPLTTLTEWPGLGHLAHEERPALAADHVIGVARRAGVLAR